MVKAIVVYESKYGNTKRVAENIIDGMKQAEGVEADLKELKKVDLSEIINYDAILIGSPTHFGGPTRGIKKFIDKLGKLKLQRKSTAVFDTYLGDDFEKAVREMEKRIIEKIPGSKIVAPGLSIRVKGMKGPIVEEEIPKCKEFGNKIATQFKT